MSSLHASTHPAPHTPVDAIGELVRATRDVFDSGRTRPIAWRIAQLEGLERMMVERESEIIEALTADLGKPALEAFAAELSVTRNEVVEHRKYARAWNREERVGAPLFVQPARASIARDPLGVVLVIAPWNYPFHLAVTPIVGAITAGNAVVLKPSEVAPHTSRMLARLLPLYVDAAAVRVIEGGVAETQRLLEERFDHIFYTGNGVVGRIVMAAAAKHLTPVTLELGGKSPVYVDASCNLDVAARRIAFGKFYNCGQTCIAPDYALVHESIHDAFLERVVKTIAEFYGSDPASSPDYGRIVNERHHRRLVGLLPSGGRVVVGGVGDESARYLAPTVLADVRPDSPVMADEIFGPILPVLRVAGADEAIRFVNARPKPLALYVFAEDESVGDAFVQRTSSGGVCINHVILQVAVSELPFGGVGESGMGRYHGRASFDTFAHAKSVLRKGTFLDPRVVYPPYTAQKFSLVRKLL